MSRAGTPSARRAREQQRQPWVQGEVGRWGNRTAGELVVLVETLDRMVSVRNKVIADLRPHLTPGHVKELSGGAPAFTAEGAAL
jgi:hypothetical protein